MGTYQWTRRELCLGAGSALMLLSSRPAGAQSSSALGTLYGIKPDGGLFWYRHDGRGDGSGRWANGGTGRPVGSGWDMYSRVFGG